MYLTFTDNIMAKEMQNKLVQFWEDRDLINTVDKIAKSMGINRSNFIRLSIRKELERISDRRN